MKINNYLKVLLFFIFSINIISSLELCGPRSCFGNLFCVSDYTSAMCRPLEQSRALVEFNLTTDGIWSDSAQFKGSIKNICGAKIRKITFNAVGFELLKPNSIWNARYTEEINELCAPDFQDGIRPGDTYTFGFISSKSEKPPLTIKSIRF